MESGLEDRNNNAQQIRSDALSCPVSMESGLEDRNNYPIERWQDCDEALSQWSPA